MATQVEELGDDRVRLTVEVSEHELQHAVEHAANDLAQSVKIPGFRKGKVPRQVLISRVGKERLMSEAVESHIAGWFWNAAAQSRLRPVEQPQYDYELPGEEDESWRFSATVAVQPKPEVADWTRLEVPKPEAEVPQELVDRELEALREAVAELVPAEGRPAREGDTVVVDLVAPNGEAQRDTVVELGAGRLVDEIEEGLTGMSPGETKSVEYELADDTKRSVEITLKDVKEKVLPSLDDDLARAASEFDTLDELRADIFGRLREQLDAEIENAFRAAAVDRLVEASAVNPSGPLVEQRTAELVNGFVRSLERRGIGVETYLRLTNTSPEEIQERLRAEATQSVARELVLEAVADKLGIEVSDDEVRELVTEQASEDEDVDEIMERLAHSGQLEQLREDLRLRAALDRVAAEAKPISTDLAEARDAIWTPEKEKPKTEPKLWTPGSKEHA